MKTFVLSTILATAFMAAPAFADCLADIARGEEAVKTMTMDQAKSDQAKALIDKAKTSHQNGDNAVCETSAKELMTVLGLQTSQ